MDARISTSLLSRAAEVLAETNRGISGPKIVSYCNAMAVDHNVIIPHASYPFRAGNKRTALFENLRAFPPHLQYRMVIELSENQSLADNEEVKKISSLFKHHYSHFDGDRKTDSPPWISTAMSSSTIAIDPIVKTTPPASQLPPTRPYEIFLSYSHVDEPLMQLVREHLMIFDRLGLIRKWWDRRLVPGTQLNDGITSALSSSDIILLFISSSFLASDYCYDIEMTQALSQHKTGRSVVVPVILRECCWTQAPFGHLLALPQDGKPLVSWTDRDAAAKNIADGVMRIVANLQK